MIPKHEEVQVFSNSSNEKAFTINASREAFRILSSGLYSNKIQAIIRELSCNAYDAHVMAGKPEEPFNVHLPDAWEPFLSIEDFGIGLDDDDVNNIYTSYFTSTKTKSNDVIGGLGLGSKTPFSYTDTFTIRARKDSVERVYNAYVSDAGSPTVSLMSESDTDEPNGVLITVPVRPEDFYNFYREASNVYRYFKTLPNMVGYKQDVDNKIVKELDDNMGLIVTSQTSGNVTAVMGNVAYTFRVTETELPADKKRAWSFLKKSSLVIRFNIGDLSVAASRETISFDEPTTNFFVDKIESIVDDYYKDFQDHIDANCKTPADAMNYVEGKLGEWAWNILNFNGQSIYELSNHDIMKDIVEILDPNGNHVSKFLMLEKRYSYSDQLSKEIVNDKYHNRKLTIKGIRGQKIGFIMDDTDHGRGFDSNARALIRSEPNCKKLILVPFVLTNDQITKLNDILVNNMFGVQKLTDVKEKFKVVRQKAAVEKGPRKTPVERAKKNEIRIDCFDGEQPTGDNYHIKKLLDIDELSKKKVGVLHISRGTVEGTVLGYGYRPVNKSELIYIRKAFALDMIILVRESQLETIKEKMPFALFINDHQDKDVVDNDFLFAVNAIQLMGVGTNTVSSFLKNLEDNPATVIDNSVFVSNYKKHMRSGDSIDYGRYLKHLDIPELNFEPKSKVILEKIKEGLKVLNDWEINSMYQTVETGYENAHRKIYFEHTKSIAEEILELYEKVLAKYPLIQLVSSIDLTDEDTQEKLNSYIKLVNKVQDLENKEELYKMVA